jgi:hypothetical protein
MLEASHSYRLFFDDECWINQSFHEAQFVEAFIRLFNSKIDLKDRLVKFQVSHRTIFQCSASNSKEYRLQPSFS